jgi:hypothetical protein
MSRYLSIKAVPQLRRLVAGVPPRRPGFEWDLWWIKWQWSRFSLPCQSAEQWPQYQVDSISPHEKQNNTSALSLSSRYSPGQFVLRQHQSTLFYYSGRSKHNRSLKVAVLGPVLCLLLIVRDQIPQPNKIRMKFVFMFLYTAIFENIDRAPFAVCINRKTMWPIEKKIKFHHQFLMKIPSSTFHRNTRVIWKMLHAFWCVKDTLDLPIYTSQKMRTNCKG